MKTAGIIFGCIACLAIGIALGFNWQQGNARQTLIKWKYGDAELEIDLDQDMADDETLLGKIFSKPFSEAGARSWLKDTKKIFHVEDTDLVNEFETLDYEADMSRELRDLFNRRVGPWSYQSDTIRFGVPGKDVQPPSGQCHVCQNKKYRGKKIELFDLFNPQQSIRVVATGTYECPANIKFPDIQLSAKDAKRLLGLRRFNKYERAIALILNN